MNRKLKAIYREGAFIPEVSCNLPEESQVELLVEGPLLLPPAVTDPEEKFRLVKMVMQRMRENPVPQGAPQFTRDELHEHR